MSRFSWLYFKQKWAARLLSPFLWLTLLVRWLVYLISATVSLFSLSALLVFLWLFVSEPGGGWLLRQVPGITVEGFSGHLINSFQAEELSWQGENQAVVLTDLDVGWQPWCLVRFTLCLHSVETEQLEIITGLNKDASAPEEVAGNQGWSAFRMPEISLPELSLPLPMTVDHLAIERFLVNGESHFHQLSLQQGRWQGTQVSWSELELKSRWVPLDASQALQVQGQLAMQGDWPIAAELRGRWQGLDLEAEVVGSLQHLQLAQLSSPGLPVTARGRLSLFTPELPVELSLEAVELSAADYWQHQEKPLPSIFQGWSEASLIDHLQIDFAGNLEQGWSLEAWSQLLLDDQLFLLDLDILLDWQAIHLDSLQLSHQHKHRMQLSGELEWASLWDSLDQGLDAIEAKAQLDWHSFFGPDFPWQLWLPEPWHLPWYDDELQLHAHFDQGRLALDADLSSGLDFQQDQLHLASRLHASLPLAYLSGSWPDLSEPILANEEKWLAWAEAIELAVDGDLEGDLQRLDSSFTAGLKFAFEWQGQESFYQLQLPKISLKGPNQEHLDAHLKLSSDSWQAGISSYLSDLELLTQPWLEGVSGDLAVTAQASLPALWAGGSLAEALNTWQQQVLAGDYQAHASAQALHWPAGHLHETALSMHYTGLLGSQLWGEQPLAVKLLSGELQLGDASPFQQLSGQLEGVLREHQIRLQGRYAEQPLELGLSGGWHPRPLNELPLAYRLEAFDTQQVSSFLPDNLRWLDAIQGGLQLGWDAGSFLMDGYLNAAGGELGIYQTDEVNQASEWVVFPYQTLAAHFNLRPEHLLLNWQLAGEQLGQSELAIQLNLHPDPETQERALAGHYRLKATDLQLLLPFLDVDDVGGYLQGEGELRGHLNAPEIWGDLRLQGVTASNVRWPVSLTRLDAEVTLQAHQASLLGDFQAGSRGEGQLEGQLSWRDQLQGELAVQGQRIGIRVEPWANLELHPDVTVTLNNGQVHLGGRLEIPSGKIEVQRLPQQAVRVSADARVINRQAPEPSLVRGFNMDVELLVGRDQLELNAFGLEADLEGRLRLGDNLDARGELLLVRGVYESFGQDLRLRRARLTFSGPVDLPFLDVEAVRDIAPGIVGIRITGRVDQPETEIFSEPAMSNEQALSWLLTGAPLEAGTDINALALSMGLAGISGYTSAVGEAIGVREFELSTEGEGDEASLVAAGYLNRRLSVRYGVGIYEDISRVAIRYELTRQLYVEVVSSIENSLDIFWEVDY